MLAPARRNSGISRVLRNVTVFRGRSRLQGEGAPYARAWQSSFTTGAATAGPSTESADRCAKSGSARSAAVGGSGAVGSSAYRTVLSGSASGDRGAGSGSAAETHVDGRAQSFREDRSAAVRGAAPG